MAGEWIECSVSDIAAPTKNSLVGGPFGSNLVSNDYVPMGIPVIRGQNMGGGRWVQGDFVFVSLEKAKALSANTARPGDLVFTQRGTLGQVAVVPEHPFDRYIISQSQMKLTVDSEKADPLFVYYLFNTREQQEHIRQNAIQTGVPHTNLGILRDTPVRLPPLPEQRAIAHILGTLDDKIELNQRMNATLEEMARAVFKSWFVDFDPVRAKLALSEVEGAEGRDTGLPREIADLFPDGFEDSELGDVPEGWEVTGLHAVAVLKKESVKPMQAPAKLWEHYSIPAFDAGRAPAVETGANIKSSKYRVPTASILVSKLNPRFPRVWLPDVQDEEAAVCSTEFMSFVPLHYAWRPFLYELMKSDVVQRGIQERVTGSTGSRQRARPEDVAVMRIVVPSPELIETFGRIVGPLHEKTLNCICESRTLAALRDTLLPKLISGELRVGDAARYLAV